MALQKTAEMEMKKYPLAADMIIKNIYFNNLVESLKSSKASKLANDIDQILKQGGFTVIHRTMSTIDQTKNHTKVQLIDADIEIEANINKCHDNKETSLEENAVVEVKRKTTFKGNLEKNDQQKSCKVLGMSLVQSTDDFQFPVKLNSSQHQRKIHTGPNLRPEEIPKAMSTILSKLVVLSQIN